MMNNPSFRNISDNELERELSRERELRNTAEARLQQLQKELDQKDDDLGKYKHLQGKAHHYKKKSERLIVVRNILIITSLVLVGVLSYLLYRQYESTKQINTLKKEYEPKPSNIPQSYYQEE